MPSQLTKSECIMSEQESVTENLNHARNGQADSRTQAAQWLLKHVRQRVESAARQASLPDSITAIEGDIIVKLMRSDVIESAPNRAYLIGATTRAMTEVIADAARRVGRNKRRPDGKRLPEDAMVEILQKERINVAELMEAIEDLRLGSPRQADVVVLRYLGGMTVAEVADKLDISVSTVESDWRAARIWLFRTMFA
jgi:RNA polymerase sigma factor (TIGR02999 family)